MRSDLEAYVYDNLPAGRFLVGRRVCDRLTRRAIRAWDHDVPRLMRIEDQVCKEARDEMGLGIVAGWLLSMLVSEIVRLLWEWFRSGNANRALMYAYQQEITNDEC